MENTNVETTPETTQNDVEVKDVKDTTKKEVINLNNISPQQALDVKDTTKKEVINLNNISPQQALDVIWKLLNKANSMGAYNIDESYTVKILMEVLAKEITK